MNDVAILHVGESRLMYPLLQDFAAAIDALFADGHRKVVLDLSQVSYVDSATIGCLMDAYRQATAAGGRLRLSGVQKRVETMLTMTGSHAFLKMYPDEGRAVASFEERPMREITTTTGRVVALDGDLLAVLETLFHEVTVSDLGTSYEAMAREIAHLIDQMTDDERRTYLAESLFINQVKYENDRLARYVRSLERSTFDTAVSPAEGEPQS